MDNSDEEEGNFGKIYIEGVEYDEYGREIEYVPPGGHCFKRFKREMDVFEKELEEWKVETFEKWKRAKKEVIKLNWKTPLLSAHDGSYEGEVKDGVPHGVGIFTF